MADFTDSFMVDSTGDAKRSRNGAAVAAPAVSTMATTMAAAGPTYDAKTRQRTLVSSFDIETTGDRVGHDVLVAFGVAAGYYDESAKRVHIVYSKLVVRDLVRPKLQAPVDMWRQRGYEMTCFEEFWAKQPNLLAWYERACQQAVVPVATTVNHPGMSQAELDAESDAAKKRVHVSYHRGRLSEDNTKIHVVFSDEAMAFCIDRALRQVEKRSRNFKCVTINDTVDFDASHVNHLLGKHGYPSTMYTRVRDSDEDVIVRVNKRYMGDRYEVDSYLCGLFEVNLLSPSHDYSRDVAPYKRWLEASMTTRNDHVAHHDAAHKVEMFLKIMCELAPLVADEKLGVMATYKDGNESNTARDNVVWKVVERGDNVWAMTK